jgi:urate oxidase
MSVVVADHSYGKSRVRLTKVIRRPDRHELQEWIVDVRLGGDFAAAYTAGDNRQVVATDTMKNRVYVLARDRDFAAPEEFALRYTGDFLRDYPQVESAMVTIEEQAWERIDVGGKPHPHAFVGGEIGSRICTATQSRSSRSVRAGIRDFPILKTSDSAFRAFYRDQYTTLPDTDDRILATLLTVEWTYAAGDHDWNVLHEQVRRQLLEVFAEHKSLGVQHTLYDMGKSVLESNAAVVEIELTMPNRHRILFNLAPFGRTNENQIFVTTDEPSGVIAAKLTRK